MHTKLTMQKLDPTRTIQYNTHKPKRQITQKQNYPGGTVCWVCVFLGVWFCFGYLGGVVVVFGGVVVAVVVVVV